MAPSFLSRSCAGPERTGPRHGSQLRLRPLYPQSSAAIPDWRSIQFHARQRDTANEIPNATNLAVLAAPGNRVPGFDAGDFSEPHCSEPDLPRRKPVGSFKSTKRATRGIRSAVGPSLHYSFWPLTGDGRTLGVAG